MHLGTKLGQNWENFPEHSQNFAVPLHSHSANGAHRCRPAPSDATALLNANASAKVLQIFDICNLVSIKPLRGTFDAPFCPYRARSPYLSGIGLFIHRPAERQDNYRLAERCMRWHTTCSVTVTRRGTAARCVCGTWENLLYYSAVKDYLTTAI